MNAKPLDIAVTANENALTRALDLRIAEMRQMLVEMRAVDTAGALRALRDAYPDVPLAERVHALAAVRH
jgi:hypothetical protein